jgi:archaellum component FlaC
MEKEITNEMIYSLLHEIKGELSSMKSDIADIKKDVKIIQEHVANIDERLTMTEKVAKLFDPAVLREIS